MKLRWVNIQTVVIERIEKITNNRKKSVFFEIYNVMYWLRHNDAIQQKKKEKLLNVIFHTHVNCHSLCDLREISECRKNCIKVEKTVFLFLLHKNNIEYSLLRTPNISVQRIINKRNLENLENSLWSGKAFTKIFFKERVDKNT